MDAAGIPFKDQFVEQCSMIRHNDQYIVHFQVMDIWAVGAPKAARNADASGGPFDVRLGFLA